MLLVSIILKTYSFAETETESFQIKNKSIGIGFQMKDVNIFHLNNTDLRIRQNTNDIILDSPKIKVDKICISPEKYKTKIPHSFIIPALLIGYGVTTLGNHGLYSSYQSRKDVMNLTGGKGSHIDNYLVVAPYLEFGTLLLLKVKGSNDFINTALLIAKSELLMFAITYPMKFITNEERPYSYYDTDPNNLHTAKANAYAFQSMPSGHTAEAFVAATIVYREYRYLSPWYGIGAYTFATTVGAYRMINDQHWQSDVFIGAGIGILSANIVYATHQHRWGKNRFCISPLYDGKNKGIAFAFQL